MELIAEFILEIAGDIAEVFWEGHLKKRRVFILYCSCILAVLAAVTISLFVKGRYVEGAVLVVFDLLCLFCCLYAWIKKFSSHCSKKSL